MKRYLMTALLISMATVLLAGCLPTQTIIVKFEDLKTDFFALESSLTTGEWAKFDWNTMTITISASEPGALPSALGSFETPRANPSTSSVPVAVSNDPDVDLRSIEKTDTLIQIMRRRQDRFEAVMNLKKAGTLGEGNAGLLAPPPGVNVSNEARAVLDAENADRLALFHEVLRQRRMGLDKLPRIQQAFAEVQRATAPRGFWIQYDEGNWEQVR